MYAGVTASSVGMPQPMSMSKEDKKREQEYREEDDHRTITRAEELRDDKSRMVGVRRHQRKAERALKRTKRSIGRRA